MHYMRKINFKIILKGFSYHGYFLNSSKEPILSKENHIDVIYFNNCSLKEIRTILMNHIFIWNNDIDGYKIWVCSII